MASPCIGSITLQAQETAASTQQQNSAQPLPAQWDLQTCIDYALQQFDVLHNLRLRHLNHHGAYTLQGLIQDAIDRLEVGRDYPVDERRR